MRNATLTLVKPVPTGVVIGPLSATLLRVIDASSSGGSVVPCSSTASAPALNVSHVGVNPVASTTRTTARVTSGPIPSPGMSVIVRVIAAIYFCNLLLQSAI